MEEWRVLCTRVEGRVHMKDNPLTLLSDNIHNFVHSGQQRSIRIGEHECLKMTLTLFTYLESTNNALE